jgi:outer membrane protein TolC
MRFSSFQRAAGFALALSCGSVGAAQAPPAPLPEPAVTTPTPALAPAPRAAAPAVTDPMLEPPAPAPRVISSWPAALELVRRHAPRYLAGAQRVQQAEARSRIALAAMLPELDGQGRYVHQFLTEEVTGPGNVVVEAPLQDVFYVGATLRVPVVDLRALRGLETGAASERVAQLSFGDERRQIALSVVDAMFATRAAARIAELNREGLRASLERGALATARLQFGRGTQLDVDRAREDVAAARADIIRGDESLQSAREALGMALGSATAIDVAPALDLDALERAVAKTCKLTPDIEQRPDIAAARARVELAERLVDDVKAQYWPRLDLVSELDHATESTMGPRTTWNVQGVLNVPLYDGGARYAQAREQRAAAAQARQALVEARLSAVVAVARTTRAVSVLSAAREVAREQRELSRSIDARIRQGYAGGLGTSLDLVLSAQSLRQAENRLVLLELDVAKARAAAVLARAECMY